MKLSMLNVPIPVVFWLVFDQLCYVGNAHLSLSDQMISVVKWATWHSCSNTSQKMTFSKEIDVPSEQGIETIYSETHGL